MRQITNGELEGPSIPTFVAAHRGVDALMARGPGRPEYSNQLGFHVFGYDVAWAGGYRQADDRAYIPEQAGMDEIQSLLDGWRS